MKRWFVIYNLGVFVAQLDCCANDYFIAEMAAMAERMKQLQELLEKNTSKSKTKTTNTTKKRLDGNKEKSSKSPSSSTVSDKKHRQGNSVSGTTTKKNEEVHNGFDSATKKHTQRHTAGKSNGTETRLNSDSRECLPKINKESCNKEMKSFEAKEKTLEKQVNDRQGQGQGLSTATPKTFICASKPSKKAASPRVRENSPNRKRLTDGKIKADNHLAYSIGQIVEQRFSV